VLRAGRLVDVDDLPALRHHAGERVELRFAEPVHYSILLNTPCSGSQRRVETGERNSSHGVRKGLGQVPT